MDRYLINGDIQPHWIGDTDRFWYLRSTRDRAKQFVVVDAATGRRTPAFDQRKIAAGLSKATNVAVDAGSLPFTTFHYTPDNKAIEFSMTERLWTCRLESGACTSERFIAKPNESLSPDGKWAVFVRAHNLWIRPTAGGTEYALTTDGVEHNAYASSSGDNHSISRLRRPKPRPPEVVWSPDSRYLVSYRMDERNVKDMYLLQSVPEDGSMRPKLWTYRYAFAGDENVPQLHPIVFNVNTRQGVPLAASPLNAGYASAIEEGNVWWSEDSAKIYFLKAARSFKSVSLNVADPASGKVTEVLRETSQTWVRAGKARGGTHRTLKNGDVIWYSDRDGWGHLYYYEGASGRLRNQITRGEWVVRAIVRVDEKAGIVYFTAGGREEGRDPYYLHLYRVNLDGSGLRLLTPEDATHSIQPDAIEATARETNGFSPSGRYFVGSYSRPDAPPIMVLRTATGRLVKRVETADISALIKDGYTPAEPFQVMAADGKTAIYGTLYRPSTFDANKKYPVIDSIYPSFNRTAKSFAGTVFDVRGAPALAELGFIVITIDGRGTMPGRSTAFIDDEYGQMGKGGNLDDHIAGIRQLAERYPYMDLNSVGITGHSGGGYASTLAILKRPDFYKVAVSTAGNHDQLGYTYIWGEIFNGPVGEGDYKGSANQNFAANLQGKLLLMHGELDDNVSPSLTMKVVDALIKANKDFDMLIIPNGSHNHGVLLSPYCLRRTWDYFVRHLLNTEPPAGYAIEPPLPSQLVGAADN
jgi:dipeptidyl aminopeptidase/acylaminoacyl peptidase